MRERKDVDHLGLILCFEGTIMTKYWLGLESSNVNPGPSKEIFLHYYKELCANNSLEVYYWNKGNIDNETVTMEELK